MLHISDDNNRTLKQLLMIPVTRGERFEKSCSDNHLALQHGELIELIVERLKHYGHRYVDGRYFLNRSTTDMFGYMEIVLSDETNMRLNVGQPARYALGIRNSNSGRAPLRFFTAAILDCSNTGVILDDMSMARKHTVGMDLEFEIDRTLFEYLDFALELNKFAHELRDMPLTNNQANATILEAARRNIICARQTRKVYEAWHRPPFKEFALANAWSLYNCFTWMARDTGISRQLKMLLELPYLMRDPILRRNTL